MTANDAHPMPPTGALPGNFVADLRKDLLHHDPLLACLLELTRLHGRPSTRAALSAGLALGVLLVFAMDFMMRLLRGHFVDLASARIDVELSVLIMERVLGIRLEAKPASVTALIDFHLPSSFCWSSPGFPGRWYSFRSSA